MSSRGNAFLYVLIAVVLFAAITFVISRSDDTNPSSEITSGKTQASVAAILGYEAQAKDAVNRMIMGGVDADSIDFTMPSSASFNTAPTDMKLFHPDGGGLQYKALPKGALATVTTSPANGYYIGRFNNFETTPTTKKDILFTAWGISNATCIELNKRITASTFVPTASNPKTLFVDASIGGVANVDFASTNCVVSSTCADKPSLCVGGGTGVYIYFSVIGPR